MADQQIPQRKRSPLSFVFSFVLIISFIFLMIMLFTNFFSNDVHFTAYQFEEALINNQVNSVTETMYDSGMIKISGTFDKQNTSNSSTTETGYYLYVHPFYYNSTKDFVVYDLSTPDPDDKKIEADTSLMSLIHNKDFVDQAKVNIKPYAPSWWDVWG
ncbi:MAG: hypothetical protein PHU89_00805, partial [Bacilli bacterium]|nr:hypothetical protein [Bacilli bacterium]